MAAPTPKGKGKAIEQTPLLDENAFDPRHSRSDAQIPEGPQVSSSSHLLVRGRSFWRSCLWTAVLAILTIFFGLILSIILLADSYAAPAWHNINKALSQSGEGSDRFWRHTMLVRGPDAISMTGVGWKRDQLGVVQLEVNMTVTFRMGVDTDFIMDFRGGSTADDRWWKKQWRELGRWSVRRLGSTTAIVDDVVVIPLKLHSSEALVTVRLPSPITIPLRPGLSIEDDNSPPSLESVPVALTIYPSQNASLIADFLRQSWTEGYVNVRLHGSNLSIRGGSERNDTLKLWNPGGWRNWLKFDKDELLLDLKLPVPTFHIPSYPPSKPGSDLPKISDILVLESFNITSVPSDTTPLNPDSPPRVHVTDIDITQSTAGPSAEVSLIQAQYLPARWSTLIFAHAAIAHPFAALAPKLHLEDSFLPLPFIVSLPVSPRRQHASNVLGSEDEVIPVVELFALAEFNATHIGIPLSGHILPFSDTSTRLPDAISAFVSSYLSYRPSSISISSPLYPSLKVSAVFPPPPHRLELLKNIRIDNMSIHPRMESIVLPNTWRNTPVLNDGIGMMEILASGTVYARVVFPPGINLNVRVTRLWVDCFVFDGKVPSEPVAIRGYPQSNAPPNVATPSSDDDEGPPLPQPLPLPTPLPARAFGRITPRNWLNATSSPSPHFGDIYKVHGDTSEKDTNASTNVFVTAQLVDVPLEVLPGRQGDLSRFVTKVLFSKGPVFAGIRGVAAVGLSIPGLTIPASEPRIEGNELVLTGLPFEGNVEVGGRDF